MGLRPYQQQAVDAAIEWTDTRVNPAVLELATGAGKAHIVAALAELFCEKHRGKTLCIQPSRELTKQNWEKMAKTGIPCNFYSASLGRSMAHDVVYGTPQTIKNDLKRFKDQFCAVLVDEAHETTPTVKHIVSHLREYRPHLRVIGLTATPYRTGQGYIYQYDLDGKPVPSKDPYYTQLLYQIQAPELIEQGFLTPPVADPRGIEYDTSGLELASTGNFTADSIDRAFVGHGRLTADIVADVVEHSRGRQGVMLFAATVAHAKEILASLPPELSDMLGGDINMGVLERERLINRFKAGQTKYLVSVGTLTRGFDATHVDVIAVLRATESPVLFQQILGRGLRLHEGKINCLLLDYAENIDRHGLHENLFAPEIKTSKDNAESEPVIAKCPDCGFENEFTARENEGGFKIGEDGYYVGPDGIHIENEHGPIPAHHGRRCWGQIVIGMVSTRCDYRWTCKTCPECESENDIAARFCESCKAELIDPNEKLMREFKRIKADPSITTTDRVLSWNVQKWNTTAGRLTVRIDFVTEYAKIPQWYSPQFRTWGQICHAVYGRHCPSVDMFVDYIHTGNMPTTITVQKPKNSQYYKIFAYNQPEDIAP